MASAGPPDRALVMRGGASDEMSSGLGGDGRRGHQAGARASAATDNAAARLAPSCSSSSTCRSDRRGPPPTCRCAASSRRRSQVRYDARIVAGPDARRSAPTRSSSAAPRRRQFAGLSVGSQVKTGAGDAGPSSASSRSGGSVVRDRALGRRPRRCRAPTAAATRYQSVLARLESPASFKTLQGLADDQPAAQRRRSSDESDYYATQSQHADGAHPRPSASASRC